MDEAHRRVSTTSPLESWRGQSPTGSQRRKLSFHPAESWRPSSLLQDTVEPQAATDTPPLRLRLLQVTLAVIYCLLAAGTVFGFAALKPVLISEGVYRSQCTQEEVDEGVWVCYGQEIRLNLMFTIAAVSTNVCALPVGAVLDRAGPRFASLVGVGFLTIGALSLAFAVDLPFDGYILGYLFLALGGPFVFIPAFQLSNAFPAHSGLVLAFLTGAFDTSSAIFLLYRLLYQASEGAFTPQKFFLAYLVVPAFILVAQLTVMPKTSYQSSNAQNKPLNPDMDEESALLGSHDSKPNNDVSGIAGVLYGVPAKRQILSPWFLLITSFTVLQMLRINYFVATIRTQYDHLLHSLSLATHVNQVFDILLPLGGIVSIPLIGGILDHTSTTFTLALLTCVATAIGVFGIIPNSLPAAYTNVVLFVLYRPLYYTAVSDYSAKVFGFESFGTVYGLIVATAGIGNFAAGGLDVLTHDVFKGDPIPVNVGLLATAGVAGFALTAFVGKQAYNRRKDVLREEAEEAREEQIPDVVPVHQ